MAVDDEPAAYWPTENLILKRNRKHYRSAVAPIHWQLRSLISAERNDVIYYPAGIHNTHITRLNTTTRECETIKVIEFNPRCLVAKGGWICCGGEKGEFAIVRDVGQTEGSLDLLGDEFRASFPSLDPANMAEASMSQLHRDMLNIVERINGSHKTWTMSSHKFGSERVNCITIWIPRKSSVHSPVPGQYQKPVAVLANNDHSVTIVSLNDSEELDHIKLPDAVNRALLSPDGTLLAAICDDPYLYLYARELADVDRTGHKYEWKQLPKIRLKGQNSSDRSDCRGSFAAAFSPSGNYLAIGTQYGTISIFNTAAFHDSEAEPLITYFNSSRAPHENGAIRDMAFSPAPYDLLAWSEHRGRVGIADVRSKFTHRQVISIETHDSFDSLPLNDRSTIDPRLLDPRSERVAGNSSALSSNLNSTSSGRPLPTPRNADSTSSAINPPYTADETMVLEAIQADRRRREALREQQRDQQGTTRGGPAWRSSVWLDRRQTLSRLLDEDLGRHRQAARVSNQTSATAEQDRERRAPTPRRRNSVIQSGTAMQPGTVIQATGQDAEGNSRSLFARVYGMANDAASASANNNTSRDSPTPWARQGAPDWASLGALYSNNITDNATSESFRADSSRTRRAIPVINDIWHDDTPSLRRYNRSNSREHQQHPDDTAGMCWSEDGRQLYIAAEDGLYSLPVNIQARKLFPDVTLR